MPPASLGRTESISFRLQQHMLTRTDKHSNQRKPC